MENLINFFSTTLWQLYFLGRLLFVSESIDLQILKRQCCLALVSWNDKCQLHNKSFLPPLIGLWHYPSMEVRRQMNRIWVKAVIFIGPRYTWGPIYGSESLKLTIPFWNLTYVTLANEDTNSILTDNANRAIHGNMAMQVTQPCN